jgi:glycerate-2-kinase
MAMPTVIRVVAVGKASLPMLKATLSILGQHVASGILVAPKDTKATGLDRRIATFRSSHPVPNEEGIRASRHVLASIARMQNHELLLCLISGGASAMLPAPAHGVTLEGKRTITQRLIQSRASIHEINTVRRHLSELKGGGLVRHCRAGAILSLITSDVPGNVISDIASGLTAPDPTTFRDAINVLNQFNLWGSAPQVVKDHLKQGLDGCFPETPKPGNRIFAKVHNFIIADNRIACEAARRALQKRRTPATILTSSANMEARSLGRLLASVARESEEFGQPLQRPGALVLGGETTVEVKGTGNGGRNQETALSAIEGIAGMNGVAIAAFGTDGIDGNSNAAGAIIDGHSMGRATRGRLQIRDFMARSDSYSFFRKLGDNIITGSTGTNVGDLYLLVRTK